LQVLQIQGLLYTRWVRGRMMVRKTPLIKEYRISKLIECLKCFDKFVYNREKQRDCVLSLYPNKMEKSLEHMEKSIFRGMVIPSLRYLGLIIGYGDLIKPSANGKLIIESKFNNDLHKRCLRAIVYEVDRDVFNFLSIIEQNRYSKNALIEELSKRINSSSNKQKKERIEKWLSILYQVELIMYLDSVTIKEENYKQTLLDIDADLKNFKRFEEFVVSEYYNLGRGTAGIVDIRTLREFVGVRFIKECKEILTENQFDYLFRKFISTTKKYHISLGEPMGADQKLFKYKDNFYKTIYMVRMEVKNE